MVQGPHQSEAVRRILEAEEVLKLLESAAVPRVKRIFGETFIVGRVINDPAPFKTLDANGQTHTELLDASEFGAYMQLNLLGRGIPVSVFYPRTISPSEGEFLAAFFGQFLALACSVLGLDVPGRVRSADASSLLAALKDATVSPKSDRDTTRW